VDAIGGPGLRILTAGKRDRHLTETEILDSCLRDVRALQMSRLRRMEQFFDRLGIDETRLDEVSWLTEQIKLQQESSPGSVDTQYQFEEVCGSGCAARVFAVCHHHGTGIKKFNNRSPSLLDLGTVRTSCILFLGEAALPIAPSNKACTADSFDGSFIPKGTLRKQLDSWTSRCLVSTLGAWALTILYCNISL